MMKGTANSGNDNAYVTGMLVLIRPEWDGGNALHVIAEWNGDRGFIRPVEWPNGGIIPTELVTAEMIQPATMYTASEIDAMTIEEIEQVAELLTDEAREEWAAAGYSGESYCNLGMNDAEKSINSH
jgi:hypothetical protein